METFNLVKRGYDPQQVDDYVTTLENVINSYKEKDAAIKNAIVSAQVAADNIIKNAQMQAAQYRNKILMQLKHLYETINSQRSIIDAFRSEYDLMLKKYLRPLSENDTDAIIAHIADLEKFLLDLDVIDDKTEEPDEL
ncbi:MAG: DivIVA domain-containing protein [Defluviitaleaceae bacterium]|nr:DivIVA domain-containing protein [Defluviitaleaceae bacterium]